MRKVKVGFRDFLGLAISSFLLWLTLKDFSFDWESLSFSKHSALFFVAGLCLPISISYLAASNFRLLFKGNVLDFKKFKTFPSYYIGHFYNSVLPGNIGEAVKIYYLSKKYDISHKQVLACWVEEKFINTLLLLLLFIPPAIFFDSPYIKPVVTGLGAIIVAAWAYVVLGLKYPFIRRLPFRLFPIRKVRRYLFSIFVLFFRSFSALCKDGRVYRVLLVSSCFYGLVMLFNYVIMRIVGIPDEYWNGLSVLLLCTVAMIASFMPSVPSSAGVMHYGIYSSYIMLSDHYRIEVDGPLNDKFVIASALFHLLVLISDVMLGGFFVYRERKWLFRKQDVS